MTDDAGKRWRLALGAAAIVAVTAAAYVPAMRAGFIWDDDFLLTDSPNIRSDGRFWRLWYSTDEMDYFPLTWSSFWIEWRLWGMNPAGYHVTNVLLHAAGAVLLWAALHALKVPGAWWAAMVYAVHPVNVESVAWISERKNTLSMVFYMLTMLSYARFLHGGRWEAYGASLGIFVLALLSKTSVVMAPVVLLGCVWWLRGKVHWKDAARTIPFFAISLAAGLVGIWFQYNRAIGGEGLRVDSVASRVATAGWAVWFYLYKALAPMNLCMIYPRRVLSGSSLWHFAPGALLVAALATAWAYRRVWGRGVFFAMGYFTVSLVPVMGFIDIYPLRFTFAADRWQYLALVGPVALATGAAAMLGREASPRARRALAAAGGGLVAVYAALTYLQAGIYRDQETLWRTNMARNPTCWMSQYMLALELDNTGRDGEAKEHYRKALALKSDFADARSGLANVLYEQGRMEEAVAEVNRALEIDPESARAYHILGLIHARKGETQRAFECYRDAVRLKPDLAKAYNNMGVLLCKEGRMEEAMPCYAQAIAVKPDFSPAHYNLGLALAHRGKRREAIEHLRNAVRLDPDFAQAHYDLAEVYAAVGRPADAVKHYRTAALLHAVWVQPRVRLAWLHATHPRAELRDATEAVALAEEARALAKTPDARLLDVLAAAYAEAGRFEEAAATARRATELAHAAGNERLARDVAARLEGYAARRPFRNAPGD